MNDHTKLPNGEQSPVSCPRCGVNTKLIVRTNRHNGSQFLGCPNWPDCSYTQPIAQHVEMELRGAARLPGF